MDVALALLFFLIALLYAAVGGGGGSGYLAVMGLLGVPVAAMRPTALTLNILVSAIGTWQYARAGYFRPHLFWPLALASVPMAYVGGRLTLDAAVYNPLVAAALLLAAARLVRASRGPIRPTSARRVAPALLAGSVIGLFSGALGLGGGIFLSPFLLLAGWADTRQTMALSAAFVLVNSVAGLFGLLSHQAQLPPGLPLWLAAAALGGWIGALLGSRHLDPQLLRRMLALVLALGALRLLVG